MLFFLEWISFPLFYTKCLQNYVQARSGWTNMQKESCAKNIKQWATAYVFAWIVTHWVPPSGLWYLLTAHSKVKVIKPIACTDKNMMSTHEKTSNGSEKTTFSIDILGVCILEIKECCSNSRKMNDFSFFSSPHWKSDTGWARFEFSKLGIRKLFLVLISGKCLLFFIR